MTANEKINLEIYKVLSQDTFLPKGGETYCNSAVYRILESLFPGNKELWNKEKKDIMMANEMYDYLKKNKVGVVVLDALSDFSIFNTPHIYIACCKGESHGHIALIKPGRARCWSGSWGKYVPLCVNIGKKNDIMPLSEAFKEEPDIFHFREFCWGEEQ